MIDFFAACARLFDMTFRAAMGLEFFRMLAGLLSLNAIAGLFFFLYRGARRL